LKLSEPHSNPDVRIISLGAGVQSTVMALMAAKGELTPMPDCAVFSDTMYEPEGVYEHLDWLEKQLPFPVYRVTGGNIKEDCLNGVTPRMSENNSKMYSSVPFFTDKGMGRRQCTYDYKILPIHRKTRELLGLKPKEKSKNQISETWIGISWDEMQRMKESRERITYNRFPLIEKRMRRHNCIEWFSVHYPGRVLAKSACIMCPFHNDELWRDMKINDPKSFKDAVSFDKKIRNKGRNDVKQYVHRSCLPLDEVDFNNSEDNGQLSFLGECDGMCGV
jgi:hypothetical protein